MKKFTAAALLCVTLMLGTVEVEASPLLRSRRSAVKMTRNIVGVQALASSSTTASVSPALGINVQDYGALPDGSFVGPQFQSAIDAALSLRRALFVPAGTYKINQTLQVPARPCCLNMRGEGKYLTTLLAAVDGMFAVVNVSWEGIDLEATNLEISDMRLDAASVAQYAMYAPGLTRSYFTRMQFSSGLQSGLFHGGWINVISECSFNGNHKAGLEFGAASNAVIVQSCSMEGNPGRGIIVVGGAQISIINNCIEGNGKEGIWAINVESLVIRDNYFEFNQDQGPTTLPYGAGSPHGGNFTFFADVVLNGDSTGSGLDALSGAIPNKGVELVGNFFDPHYRTGHLSVPCAGFLIAGLTGGTLADNSLAVNNYMQTLFIISTSDFWEATNLEVSGNNLFWDEPGPIRSAASYPTGFYLHNANATYNHGRVSGVSMRSALGQPTNKRRLAKLAYQNFQSVSAPLWGWGSPVRPSGTTTGCEMTAYPGAAGRLQANDSIVLLQKDAACQGQSQVYGMAFQPVVDETLNNLPIHTAMWVKALTNNTVVSLILSPGAGAPLLRSSDAYLSPQDGWVQVGLAGILPVPSGGQSSSEAPYVGIYVVNDNTMPGQGASVAIGGWAPFLAPVGVNPEEDF